MKQILSRPWIKVLFLLTLIGLLSYSLLLPWLGFYYDDWPFAWITHRLGPTELIEAFKPFRPFLAPYFLITTSLMGESPILWHVFNIVVRILLALILWWTLQQIWPDSKRQTIWVALFFLVYPGFSQQWVSLTLSIAVLRFDGQNHSSTGDKKAIIAFNFDFIFHGLILNGIFS